LAVTVSNKEHGGEHWPGSETAKQKTPPGAINECHAQAKNGGLIKIN